LIPPTQQDRQVSALPGTAAALSELLCTGVTLSRAFNKAKLILSAQLPIESENTSEGNLMQTETPVPVECPACGTFNASFQIQYKVSPGSMFHCRFCGWSLTRPLKVSEEEKQDISWTNVH
jgi:hypothetical protein